MSGLRSFVLHHQCCMCRYAGLHLSMLHHLLPSPLSVPSFVFCLSSGHCYLMVLLDLSVLLALAWLVSVASAGPLVNFFKFQLVGLCAGLSCMIKEVLSGLVSGCSGVLSGCLLVSLALPCFLMACLAWSSSQLGQVLHCKCSGCVLCSGLLLQDPSS